MLLLSRRELLAAAVAPLVAPVGYWAGLTLYGVVRWLGQRGDGVMPPSLADLLRPLPVVLLVGAPVAWATALAGLPVYLAVRAGAAGGRLDGVPPVILLLLASAGLGAAVAWLMGPQLRGELFSIPFPPWAGALLGVAVGATFLRMVSR